MPTDSPAGLFLSLLKTILDDLNTGGPRVERTVRAMQDMRQAVLALPSGVFQVDAKGVWQLIQDMYAAAVRSRTPDQMPNFLWHLNEASPQVTDEPGEGRSFAGIGWANPGQSPHTGLYGWVQLEGAVSDQFEDKNRHEFWGRLNDCYLTLLTAMQQQPAPPLAAIPGDEPKAYTIAAMRELTGLSNGTLNRYAKAAGVQAAQRGKRNFRYTTADVRAILQKIVDTTSEKALRERCRAPLESL